MSSWGCLPGQVRPKTTSVAKLQSCDVYEISTEGPVDKTGPFVTFVGRKIAWECSYGRRKR